jgi:hypothetical protein
VKIEELFLRATREPEFAERLRDLAYEARDTGMKGAAYKKLVREMKLAETPADLKALNSSMGYLMVLNGVLSKFPVLCLLVRPGEPTIPKPIPSRRGADAKASAARAANSARTVRRKPAASKGAVSSKRTT